jgi:hypothetical protein
MDYRQPCERARRRCARPVATQGELALLAGVQRAFDRLDHDRNRGDGYSAMSTGPCRYTERGPTGPL